MNLELENLICISNKLPTHRVTVCNYYLWSNCCRKGLLTVDSSNKGDKIQNAEQ